MLLEMKVPSPGESISEVEIIEWLVTDGDYVEKDQSIAEIDSDKATLELPAEESGIIKILTKEGVTVAVGDVVLAAEVGGTEIDERARAPVTSYNCNASARHFRRIRHNNVPAAHPSLTHSPSMPRINDNNRRTFYAARAGAVYLRVA